MKISEILTELGNTEYPYTTKFDNYSDGEVICTASPLNLDVHFVRIKNEITIIFRVNDSAKMTGTGNSVKIMSTVLNILRHELPKVINRWANVVDIRFSSAATDISRTKLYARAIPLISQILGSNWAAKTKPSNFDTEFIWIKDEN